MKIQTLLAALAVLLTLGLAALSAPAHSQDDPAPEATPEPSPIVIDPDGFTLLFRAEGKCSLSPDAGSVTVAGQGVYDLTTRRKLFDAETRPTVISPDGRFAAIGGEGVFDRDTGQQVLESDAARPRFNYDGSLYMDFVPLGMDVLTELVVVYSVPDFQPVMTLDRSDATLSHVDFGGPILDVYYKTEDDGYFWIALDTTTWEVVYDPREYIRDGLYPIHSSDFSLVAVMGDAVYEHPSRIKRFDLPYQGDMWFNPDNTELRITTDTEVIYLDALTGEVRERWAWLKQSALKTALSEDGQTLLVSTMKTLPRGGSLTRDVVDTTYVIDVLTGNIRFVVEGAASSMLPSFVLEQSLILVDGRGLYDVMTGARVLEATDEVWFPVPTLAFAAFNHVHLDVYDTATWEYRYRLPGTNWLLSPNRRWVAINKVGVFDIETGEQVLTLSGQSIRFHQDGRYIVGSAKRHCEVYHLPESTGVR